MVGRHKDLLKEKGYDWGHLKTLYIGGGTPSLWGEEGAKFVEDFLISENLTFLPQYEFTLEVNPGTWTREGIKAWRDIGTNRFSLGIQSLRQDYLKILDRVHSVQDVHDTLGFFNDENLSFSVDFMLGLPESLKKNRDIEKELEEILSYDPDHISLYILTPKAGYPLKEKLPDDSFQEGEYLAVAQFLKSRGFDHYEVSNFSKPGKESLHNIQYWRSESVAALGPSAVGFLSEEKYRYKWKVTEPEISEESLDQEAFDLERLYMGLRINEGILLIDHFSNIEVQKLEPLISQWVNEKKAHFDQSRGHLSLTSSGFLVLDSLLGQVFSRLNT